MAVERIRVTNLHTLGPGLSALIRCMLLPPASGTIQSTKTNTPIPPIQCVKLRQNKKQFDKASTSERIVAPVVVYPDIVSNKASNRLGISPLIKNGSAPEILSTIHPNATLTNPSLA